MTKKILVIDDLRNFKNTQIKAEYARNSYEGVEKLKEYSIIGLDEIWLDHDLGKVNNNILNLHEKTPIYSSFGSIETENTSKSSIGQSIDDIWPIIDWLIRFKTVNDFLYPVTIIKIHTSNNVGGERMMNALNSIGYSTEKVKPEAFFIVEN